MKRFFYLFIGLSLLICITACGDNSQSPPYLSIATTYYNDEKGPENGMTISVLKKELTGDLKEMGTVAYTSQYPLGVYNRQDHSIYYSAVDDSGNYDQVWCLNLDTHSATQLTSDLFAINYIIPRQTDVVIIGIKRKERQIKPFIYDKKSGSLTEIQTTTDFNCGLCTYNAQYDRLIMVGTSYSQAQNLRSKWNEGQRMLKPAKDNIYYPPDTYIYEVDQKGDSNLLLKLNRYEVKHIAIRSADEILYSGLPLKHADVPMTQFRFKTGHKPEEYNMFESDFPLTIYDEFSFSTEQDAYVLGMGKEETPNKYPYGIYHYNCKNQKLTLVYNGSTLHDSYINNFLLLK